MTGLLWLYIAGIVISFPVFFIEDSPFAEREIDAALAKVILWPLGIAFLLISGIAKLIFRTVNSILGP